MDPNTQNSLHQPHRWRLLEMRTAITLFLVALMPVPVLAQGKRKKVQPVKIIELTRKEPIVYQKDIEPIIRKRCVACHSGSIKEGNFDVGTYESLMKGGKRGTPVVPGKSEKSVLYTMLTRKERPFMPPRSEDPVTPIELALVKLWIDQGAKAPTGESIRPKVIVGIPNINVKPVRAVACSPDKSTIAAGRGNQIHVYDAKSGTHIRTLFSPGLMTHDKKEVKAAHLSIVESMAFSPDGKYLVSGSFQEIAIWDVQTGTLRKKNDGFAHNVVALTFSNDGKLLATAGGAPTEDGELKFFEVGSWKQLGQVKDGHSDTIYGISFSPDAKHIASSSADKFVKVFEVPNGKFVKSFEGHTHHVLDVGWSPDGKYLASAGADNVVKVWDYKKGEQTRTIKNVANKQITRLKFFGKSADFLVGAGDGTVRFLRCSNGGTVYNFSRNNDYLYAVDVTPDGFLVAVGGQDGVIRVYNRNKSQPVKTLEPPTVQASAK